MTDPCFVYKHMALSLGHVLVLSRSLAPPPLLSYVTVRDLLCCVFFSPFSLSCSQVPPSLDSIGYLCCQSSLTSFPLPIMLASKRFKRRTSVKEREGHFLLRLWCAFVVLLISDLMFSQLIDGLEDKEGVEEFSKSRDLHICT